MHWAAVLLAGYAAAVLELKRLCDAAPLCDDVPMGPDDATDAI